MSRNVIRDGQTRRGKIEAVSGQHDEIVFEFRPMIAEETEQANYLSEQATERTGNAGDGVAIVIDEIAKHLVSWSEVDEKGRAIEPSVANVRQLSLTLVRKLFLVINGSIPSGVVPKPTDDELAERLAKIRESAAGVSAAESEHEQTKNSEPG